MCTKQIIGEEESSSLAKHEQAGTERRNEILF